MLDILINKNLGGFVNNLAEWISVLAVIVFPTVGWIFRNLITKDIDELNKKIKEIEESRKESRELFFKRLDEIQADVKVNYVRRDLYDQAMQFHQKETDSKFNNLVESMNKQFDNVEKNIDEVKKLINEKINIHKIGG